MKNSKPLRRSFEFRARLSIRAAVTSLLSFSLMFVCSYAFGQETKTESTQETKPTTQESATPAAETAPAAEPIEVKVAGGAIQFTATGSWKAVKPRSRMLEAELMIPKVGEDEQNGRLTIMGAGGSIDANIERWKAQFKQADGGDTSDFTKVEKKTIADQTVNMVDITGTFIDSPGGPFSGQPKVERANYRMISAIVETEDEGNYFIKFYGPKATVDKNAEAFKAMIESLKVAQ